MTASEYEQLIHAEWQPVVSRLAAFDDPEGAAGEAALIVWRNRDRIALRSAKGYWFVVARNLARSERNRHKGRLARGPGAAPACADAHDQAVARERLRVVAGMRPGRRTALTARMLGLSYKETGEATGRTYSWVNRHVTGGRAELRAKA